jgi:nitrile hydratase
MMARFAAGDPVRVRFAEPRGHCRTPYYLRGKRGVIERLVGVYPNPEELAYHRLGLPHQPLYQVKFDFGEVWGRAERNVTLSAAIYQHWLEPDSTIPA